VCNGDETGHSQIRGRGLAALFPRPFRFVGVWLEKWLSWMDQGEMVVGWLASRLRMVEKATRELGAANAPFHIKKFHVPEGRIDMWYAKWYYTRVLSPEGALCQY